MSLISRFIFGLILGSFLNVVSLRYDPDKFILHSDVLGGRSRCPHCGTRLRWKELIPLVSFLVQSGLCRSCKTRLSLQYPLVEFLSGLISVAVPWSLGAFSAVSVLWVVVLLTLLLIALIDLRLRIIPDELSVFLILLAFPLIYLSVPSFSLVGGSFIGHYALLFGWRENLWLNHIFGFLVGALFFLVLILATWGKGMGGGDMKLVAALGFLFGWPDIAVIIPLSFILGSFFALPLLISGRRGRKDFLPFGPFLVLSTTCVFFFGFQILNFYFSFFGI